MARRSGETPKRGIPAYISGKTGELAQMAEYGGYPLVAYLLRIAQAEAKRSGRQSQRALSGAAMPWRGQPHKNGEALKTRRVAG